MRRPDIDILMEIVNLYNTMIDIPLCRITLEEDTEPMREMKHLVHILKEEETMRQMFSKITTREELSQEYPSSRKNYQQIPPKGLPTTSRYSPIITNNTRKYNY